LKKKRKNKSLNEYLYLIIKIKYKMTEFIANISPEKRKKRELKYTLYTDGSCDDKKNGGWASIILDKNEQQFTISDKEVNTTNNRMEMIAIIEGLNWIYSSVEQRYRKYINVVLYSDSVYCVNTIREWLDKWKDDGSIETRPNGDLLKQLLDIKDKIHIDAKWIQRVSNEYAWSVDKIANERRNEN
jgi:ribonuclease HI